MGGRGGCSLYSTGWYFQSTLSQNKQLSFTLTHEQFSINKDMSSRWNFEVLCLCHWQIMHDLNSNSPFKLEYSVLGFKCQLIRTQICWEIEMQNVPWLLPAVPRSAVCGSRAHRELASVSRREALLCVHPAAKPWEGRRARMPNFVGSLHIFHEVESNWNEDKWRSRGISCVSWFLSPFHLADMKAEFWTILAETERERLRESTRDQDCRSQEKFIQILQTQEYRRTSCT